MQQNSREMLAALFTECQSGGGTLLHADGALGANTKRRAAAHYSINAEQSHHDEATDLG